jgi:hypothetical protein
MDAQTARAPGWHGLSLAIVRSAVADVMSALIPLLILLAMTAAPFLLASIAGRHYAPSAVPSRPFH